MCPWLIKGFDCSCFIPIFAVFPNICSLSLAAFSSVKEWKLKIKYWENVYGKTECICDQIPCMHIYYSNIIGFCMSCIKDEVLNEASVDLIDSFSIISSSDTFKVRRLWHLHFVQTSKIPKGIFERIPFLGLR